MGAIAFDGEHCADPSHDAGVVCPFCTHDARRRERATYRNAHSAKEALEALVREQPAIDEDPAPWLRSILSAVEAFDKATTRLDPEERPPFAAALDRVQYDLHVWRAERLQVGA